MHKAEVRNILEATLKSGTRAPGLLDLARILAVRSKLESCASVVQVIGILEENRGLITRSFGVSDEAFDSGVEKLKALV